MFNPDVRVYIKGTNKDGIFKYIKASLVKPGGPSEEDANQIIEACEQKLFSLDILYVPLYLTLITVVFDQHFAKYPTFSKFQVPNTMTELFNAFVSVLLRLWVRRSGQRTDTSLDGICNFSRSPVGPDSTVPIDIQGKLFLMGRMSFEFLLKRCYEFTEDDLVEYLISKQDVILSGMYCTEKDTEQPIFYLRHKTMQEYLAAIYLSNIKLQHVAYNKMIDENIHNRKKVTLDELFSPLQLCMKFVFGVSPNVAVGIVENMRPNVGLTKNTVTSDYCIDMLYLAELCMEGCDEKLNTQMELTLLKMDTFDKNCEIYNQYSNLHVLLNFANILTRPTVSKLLKKYYNVNIDSKIDNIKMSVRKHSEPVINRMELEFMDMACLALMSAVNFPDITSLKLNKSMIMDLGVLTWIFPALEMVDVSGYTHYDMSQPNTEHKNVNNETVKEVSLQNTFSLFSRSLPMAALQNLSKQTNLSSLHIYRINIFSHVKQGLEVCNSPWEGLKHLTVFMDFFRNSIPQVCEMVKHCKQLENLKLEELSVFRDNLCSSEKAEALFTALEQNCTKLKQLELMNIFERKWVRTLCKFLPDMHLQYLCFSELDTQFIDDPTVDTVLSCHGLKDIHIYCGKNSNVKLPNILNKLHSATWLKVSYIFND